MKSIKIIVVAIIALSIQTISARNFEFGAKAGMTVSTVSGESDVFSSAEVRANVGATLGMMFRYYNEESWWGLSAETIYAEQGNRITFNDLDSPVKIVNKDLYINIPVMFNYYFLDGFSFNIGAQAGIFCQRRTMIYIDGDFAGKTWKDPGAANRWYVDVAVPFSLAYRFKDHYTAEARYSFGVFDAWYDNLTDERYYNNVLSLTFGYIF